jgi:preprotein translocase subunit SecE
LNRKHIDICQECEYRGRQEEQTDVKWTFPKLGRENKKSTKPAKAKGKRRKENAIVRYFRQTWAELKKVHWPNRQEAMNLSMIVLAATVALSAFLGLVDWLSALFFSLLVKSAG